MKKTKKKKLAKNVDEVKCYIKKPQKGKRMSSDR